MKRFLFSVLLLVISAYGSDHYLIFLEGNRSHDNLELGIPNHADQIIDREGYALGFSQKWRQPQWVIYRLTREEASVGDVKRSSFLALSKHQLGSAVHMGSRFYLQRQGDCV